MSIDAAVARLQRSAELLKKESRWNSAAFEEWQAAQQELMKTLRTTIEGLGPPFDTLLVLDQYERDNLVAHLGLVHEGWFPGNTGDWCGQIRWKISPNGYDPKKHQPNETPDQQIKSVRAWRPREK